ncbi:MAG: hypothetical protein DI603_10710 [Roseateles depolymerans]|uniref:DUF4243 domain-containing protein n=1 Tax=Roseateles depolymerans TaxID=76731 RepID=A0A2W5DKT4_9BURK|nr:MAG: hypothetical protein DI603_10710 [Roseateles depolymerans]
MLTQTTSTSSSAPSSGADPSTRDDLHRLLEAGLRWSGSYRGRLSNHLPMVWQALHELGATRAQLQCWTETYGHLLEPVTALRPAGDPGGDRLGQPGSEAGWRAHFLARIEALGQRQALREALVLLMPGVGAVAFHGLIRTAHAVAAGHAGELAAALAHWAEHYEVLTEAVESHGAEPLAWPAWLRALQALPAPAQLPRGLISDQLRAWARVPGFAQQAGALAITSGSLQDLALSAARAYAASGHFTLLHLVTASHAMSVLQPLWPTPLLPRAFTGAAAAAWCASGASLPTSPVSMMTSAWPALIAAASTQTDAHVIKLVHAAWMLDRRWPDDAWRAAAVRALANR